MRDMIDDGIKQAVGSVLAPHYSSFSIAKYQQRVRNGSGNVSRAELILSIVDSYNTAPKYIQALVNRVREGIDRFPPDERDRCTRDFERTQLAGTDYQNGRPLSRPALGNGRAGGAGGGFARRPVELELPECRAQPRTLAGPQIENYIPELAKQGIRNMVSVPIGFVSDHVEILFDIDIKARRRPSELGCGWNVPRP